MIINKMIYNSNVIDEQISIYIFYNQNMKKKNDFEYID